MLKRLEIREIPVICEWDEDDGRVSVGMGGNRDRAWGMMTALHDALERETPVQWVDEELRERIDTKRCVGLSESATAVVWSATFYPPSSVVHVPSMIAAAAGVMLEIEDS